MRKLIILSSALCLTACSTNPQQQAQQKELVKTVAVLAVIAVVANSVGDSNQKSKCANNRAGFWQDHSTGKIYTCP